MGAIDQGFRQVKDLSEVEDVVEALENGFEDSVQTDFSHFVRDVDLKGLEPDRLVSNHHNYANGVETEKAVAAIYGLGPANSARNQPPDLISSMTEDFDGERVGYEVKSCNVGRNTLSGIRPGRYVIPLDSHEEMVSDGKYSDVMYIMASRIPDEDVRLASIAVLSPQDIDMLMENDDLPGVRRFEKQRSSREFLSIEEPLANRVAETYNHSRYPGVEQGYSRELEEDFRKSFDPETVEYWFDHPDNSVKSQRKYEA
ncbi:MAG: hypothetical protein V5A72_01895 [Candidatus Nanohaloarchaea archaeon]